MPKPVVYHIHCPSCKRDLGNGVPFFYPEFVELVAWCKNCGGEEVSVAKNYLEILDDCRKIEEICAEIPAIGIVAKNTNGGKLPN